MKKHDLYKSINNHLNDECLKTITNNIDGKIPRDDQVEVVKSILFRICKDSSKGFVVQMPTGSGKTLTTMLVIRWLISYIPNIRIAFMVHRIELLEQTKKVVDKSFGIGKVNISQGARHIIEPNAQIHLYMEQTAKNRDIEYFDIAFIDECHNLNYKTFIQSLMDEGTRVIGLSATPDDHRLLEFFDRKKILGEKQVNLEKNKILAEPIFFRYEHPQEELDLLISEEDVDKKSKIQHEYIKKVLFDEIIRVEKEIVQLRINEKKHPLNSERLRWLIKTQRIEYAKELETELNSKGIKSMAFYSGHGYKNDIDRIFDGSHPMQYRVAIVVQRFSVGYDHPGIQGLILTGSSEFAGFVQSVGRVLRPGYPPIKDQSYIHDMGYNWDSHAGAYQEQRCSPVETIPLPPKSRLEIKEKGISILPYAEKSTDTHHSLGQLVVVKLENINDTIMQMPKPVLLAFCITEAYKWANNKANGNWEMAFKRAKTNWWFLTGYNVSNTWIDQTMHDSHIAQAIWSEKEQMPKQLGSVLKARRKRWATDKMNAAA